MVPKIVGFDRRRDYELVRVGGRMPCADEVATR
jgi:hypothetical protein